ncbi:MAG: 4-(cytidine 5'-diphospho)-2-C-methyl-D-erythritol kinase [Rhodobacteraceae bacterium]|nr:MAG: 4-(cytidine 5'-diphospho)-2-C-methyl-D-erythritol kinase [Paracoccaceae bacterium]
MTNKVVHAKANAKINLALHVLGTRSDGLHLLDSLVAFPDYGDELIFEKSDHLRLSVVGPFGNQLLKDTSNLSNIITKAANLLKGHNNGVAITLIKNLPPSSGIGGGSSNAATTLKILSKLWGKKMPDLNNLLKLGADVPVCLSNELQRMKGIGEKLTTLSPPPPMWIVLANPGIRVSTEKIFKLLTCKENKKLEPLFEINNQDSFFAYLKRQRNDLESVTTTLFPEVRQMLELIMDTNDCKVCRMSGSGATCFGLYSQQEDAIQAEQKIKERFIGSWVVSAKLFSANSCHDVISYPA